MLHLSRMAEHHGRDRRNIVKPNDGYGGFGILVGQAATQQEWEKLIDDAFAKNVLYTAQDCANIPVDTFPVVADGKIQSFDPKNVNLNPGGARTTPIIRPRESNTS